MANSIITHFRLTFKLKGEKYMILYDRLWETMKKKNITQYALINKYHVSAGQLTRLRKNESVTTHTIDTLCSILECDVEDIMEYRDTQPKEE